MIKRLVRLLVCITALLSSTTVLADVQYKFSGFFGNNMVDQTDFTGTFTITLPTYVTSDMDIPASAISNCQAGMFQCGGIRFVESAYEAGYTSTDHHVHAILFSDNIDMTDFYYFDIGAFTTPGVYNESIFGGATLTVSEVPEPSILLSLSSGLGLLGLVARRRQRA
ncbi:PEP-CTERM sorting domain-containing protein [Duganella sp. FT80W]|uniref:PEP-CTERM sorting domain-containing protein n=1 Tax=Duganella guangzhouensis TaxID=2666084 RepID=A0A6I2L8Z3_9BURK|nr:PEP-CTERM sorting domain-containing protein [Duganella guangzhouensis]MRW94162.1 PEP-CTERM sorting domain-containing protein [Duganella guangzhouensis]